MAMAAVAEARVKIAENLMIADEVVGCTSKVRRLS